MLLQCDAGLEIDPIPACIVNAASCVASCCVTLALRHIGPLGRAQGGARSPSSGAPDDADTASAILRISPGSSVWRTGMCPSANSCRCGQCHVLFYSASNQRRLDMRHNSRDIHAVFCIPVVVNWFLPPRSTCRLVVDAASLRLDCSSYLLEVMDTIVASTIGSVLWVSSHSATPSTIF